jgi:tetratricopeptide (TPR) repeat protein
VPLNGMGKTHTALGRPFAAVRSFNRAITLNAKYYSAHANRAEALVALEQPEEAIADYSQIVEQRPEDPKAYLARGSAYAKARKYNAAYRDFDKAIKLAPDMAEPYLERAELHLTLKRYDRAHAELTKAIERNPELVVAYVKRAETSLRLGKPGEGLEDANQALRLKPSDPAALFIRAKIHDSLESREMAIADYQEVLKADPENAEAREALNILGAVQPPTETEAQSAQIGEVVKGWRVVRTEQGRYIATNRRYPKMKVPLEMYGEGEPKIIDWNLLKYELRGIGLLEYFAGSRKDEENKRLEYVAIVDLWKNRTVAVEPDSWGSSKATWDWQRVSVVVTDPLGNANEVKLRRSRGDSYAYDADNPWFSDGEWHERTRSRPRRRRRAPRGLFDWLFNN